MGSSVKEYDAVTYKDLFLSSMNVAYIQKLDIVQRPGKHASLELNAVLNGEQEENEFQNIGKTLTLLYQAQEGVRPLFYGIIDKTSIEKDGSGVFLYLEAWDATQLMDTDRRSRAFQNPQMTPQQLMDVVMRTYPGADYKLNVPELPIGQLIIQYEETDWEFLNRFFSHYQVALYPNPEFDRIRLLAGESPDTERFEWDHLPFILSQDYIDLNRRRENGFEGLSIKQNMQYCVESYDIASLGNKIQYKGNQWYVGGVERHLEKGILISRYLLWQKEGLKILPYFNSQLTGVSIDGQITAAKRDRVQVEMEIDAGAEGENRYWFPYSTVASSSDGSGWYCMPENGESIRVYFPVPDEKEAYVVTNIKAHEPVMGNPSDSMGNPNVRNIETAQGNLVRFTEEGVEIAAGSGEGNILLKKSGEVILDAAKDITISAGKAINIVAANEVILKSQTSIRVASEQGADVELKEGRISLHGMLINEN